MPDNQTTDPAQRAAEIAEAARAANLRRWRTPPTPVERLRLMLAMVEADIRDGDINGARMTLRAADELIQQLPRAP